MNSGKPTAGSCISSRRQEGGPIAAVFVGGRPIVSSFSFVQHNHEATERAHRHTDYCPISDARGCLCVSPSQPLFNSLADQLVVLKTKYVLKCTYKKTGS